MQPVDRNAEAQSTATGRHDGSLVVSPHHLSSEAALEILGAGGNAVDAAIAANAVQGVVAPQTCGIGGDLFALIHTPGSTAPLALNASGRAGSGITAEELRKHDTTMPDRHPATITAPGCVDGWVRLSSELGRVTLEEALAPSIRAASDGFTASTELASAAARLQPLLAGQPSARPLYPSGAPIPAGELVQRPGLAETLRAIAVHGRRAFYDGDTARRIASATDDVLTADDLARPHADWVEPLRLDVMGATAWTTPPNTQGYIALAAAWIFEQLEAPPDPTDPGFHHAVIESYRSIAWERDELLSDPATAPLPSHALLQPERLARFVDQIDLSKAGAFPPPRSAPGGTAYLCVRDGEGMGVSLIQSNFWGIGSGRSVGATGVFLHNRGAGFNLVPGHPNEYAPGRRPLHTLSPTLWTRDGRLAMLLGTRGGQFQPQLLLQMLTALLYVGVPPDAAQLAPRWQVTGWQRGESPTVRLESRYGETTAAGLVERAHDVQWAEPFEPGWGPMSVIVESDRGVLGAADPRITTASAAAQ
jgi:gamma-glutamyltranspeptidase/glutathione hydrolase